MGVTNFVVVTTDDWREKGVVFVTLSSDEECKPDAFYLPAKDVGSGLINLQIGNSDWAEKRNDCESFHQARIADDRNDANRDNDNDKKRTTAEQGAQKDASRQGSLAKPFLVYNASFPPQSANSIFDVLDPGWEKKDYKSDEHFI